MPVLFAGLIVAILGWLYFSTPDPSPMKGCLTTTMFEVNLCPGSNGYVALNEISDVAVSAILVSEDGAFYQHQGFDWFELKASFESNFKAGGYKRGGSTITQQLAKNVFLSPEKSILRKLREAILTYRIEHVFSKREILERYLNVVELGPNIFGIKAAAQHYFSKTPRDLNVLEGAFLAYLLPNPKKYSGVFTKLALTPFARERVLDITHRLMRFGKISEETFDSASAVVDQFPWSTIGGFEGAQAPWDPSSEFTPPENMEESTSWQASPEPDEDEVLEEDSSTTEVPESDFE